MNFVLFANKKERIRPIFYYIAVFVFLMLFQTSYLYLGTIFAFVSLVLIFSCFFSTFKRIKLNVETGLLIALSISIFISNITLLSLTIIKYLSLVFLCILLSNVEMTEKENSFIKTVFVLGAVFYSLLIIRSRLTNYTLLFHSRIILFGTTFDPNFIGLPLVFAYSIILFRFLNKRITVLRIVAMLVLLAAIAFTSSRGNFIGLIVTTVLNFIFFLFGKKWSFFKKTLIMILFASFIVLIVVLAPKYFPDQIERMLSVGKDGSDNGRLVLWGETIEIWKGRPIFGGGYNYMIRAYGPESHNMFLQVLSDEGIVGFTCFVCFIVYELRKVFLVDKCIFICMIGMLLQCVFLSACDDRVLWIAFCICALNPSRSTHPREKTNKQSIKQFELARD